MSLPRTFWHGWPIRFDFICCCKYVLTSSARQPFNMKLTFILKRSSLTFIQPENSTSVAPVGREDSVEICNRRCGPLTSILLGSDDIPCKSRCVVQPNYGEHPYCMKPRYSDAHKGPQVDVKKRFVFVENPQKVLSNKYTGNSRRCWSDASRV